MRCTGQAKTDTPLSYITKSPIVFELIWTLVAQVRMQPPALVDYCDVRESGSTA